jgi:uncharacterized repeat protein (TIGR03833 family)
MKDGTHRADIRPGVEVDIVLKKDQPSGTLTRGIVKELLTSKDDHPRGIKVRLMSGDVGRVQHIVGENAWNPLNTLDHLEKDLSDDFDNFV